jgi:23S rRNA (guanosine2251-2'-O)-methyltransferase
MDNKKLSMDELGRMNPVEFEQSSKTPLILILDDVRSHLNVGSVFRSADAFRVEKIYLCGITGCPPHRDIQKTALGATETVKWEYRDNILELIEELKNEGVQIASVEQTEHAVKLQNMYIQPSARYAVVFGNEVDGVKQQVINQSDFGIEIPQFGTKHSLNISVCAGIVMWEWVKKILQAY